MCESSNDCSAALPTSFRNAAVGMTPRAVTAVTLWITAGAPDHDPSSLDRTAVIVQRAIWATDDGDDRNCEDGVVNALEEGTVAQIDFEKVRSAARSTHALIPVVIQDVDSHEVLFVGYANDLALEEALGSGRAVLWSASRDELWIKGATSGDILDLLEVRVNCEQNALLYLVRPRTGGACHTTALDGASRRTCFYRSLADVSTLEFIDEFAPAE